MFKGFTNFKEKCDVRFEIELSFDPNLPENKVKASFMQDKWFS